MGMFTKGIQFSFQTPDQAQLDGYLFKTLSPSLPAHNAGGATIKGHSRQGRAEAATQGSNQTGWGCDPVLKCSI